MVKISVSSKLTFGLQLGVEDMDFIEEKNIYIYICGPATQEGPGEDPKTPPGAAVVFLSNSCSTMVP